MKPILHSFALVLIILVLFYWVYIQLMAMPWYSRPQKPLHWDGPQGTIPMSRKSQFMLWVLTICVVVLMISGEGIWQTAFVLAIILACALIDIGNKHSDDQ